MRRSGRGHSVNGDASGTVTIDGEEHPFTAAAVDQDGYAGLYATGDGEDTTARWIVLDDQTVRGAARRTGAVQVAPPIQPWVDPTPDPAQIQGAAGQFNPVRTQPWIDPSPQPWIDPEPTP